MSTHNHKRIRVTLKDVLEAMERGFKMMATKEDLRELEERIDKIDSKIDGFTNRVERVEDNYRVIKTHIGLK